MNKLKIKKLKKILLGKDDEPGVLHYLFIIGIIFSLVFFLYIGYLVSEQFEVDRKIDVVENRYQMKFELKGNQVINFEFFIPVEQIKKLDYNLFIKKEEFLNTKTFRVSHINYTLEERKNDSGYNVGKTSSRLVSMLGIFGFKFEIEDVQYNLKNFNCKNSTIENKVIIFDTTSNKNEVLYDNKNGCVQFFSKSPKEMVFLGDSFFLKFLSNY